MDKSTFNKFRKIVYEKSGISLSEGKEALVTARISKRMRALGIAEHRDYLRYVLKDESGEEVVHLLDSISTNVTSFFREANHFDFLREAVSGWLEEGQRRLRFWSAACSTGEEPYSLAMTLLEVMGGGNVDLKILATDISTRALAKAQEATYSEEKLKNVPSAYRNRYFNKLKADGEVRYTVKSKLKNMIVYRRLNLSRPPFPMRGPIDSIFCRNVMIYFDNRVRADLLTELYRLVKPSGFLMVGHAESLTGMVSDFTVVKPSIYRKK